MQTTAYGDLVKVVQAYYDPKPSTIVQRYKFNLRSRRDGKAFTAYDAALRELAMHCEYGNSLADMLRDRLVCGIRQEAIQKCLLAIKDLTYEKAFQMSVAIEMAEKGTQDILNDTKKVHHTGRACTQQTVEDKKKACYRCGGEHLAPDCRFKCSLPKVPKEGAHCKGMQVQGQEDTPLGCQT